MDSFDYSPSSSELAEAPQGFAIEHSFRIADAHAHIYPSKIAAKATAAVGSFYDAPMNASAGSPECLLARGSAIGVEKYLVCSVATKVEQAESISRFIASQCQEHQEFIGLGAYHQDIPEPSAFLDLVQELGLRGVKVHPDFQRFDIDDPKLFPLYAELEKRGLFILFHTGDNRYEYSAPIRLLRVMHRFPQLKAIAAHLGGYQRWADAAQTFAGSNLLYDCSSALAFLSPWQAAEQINILGPERVFFGVDFPMWGHREELARFFSLSLGVDANKAILYGNFAREFGLD